MNKPRLLFVLAVVGLLVSLYLVAKTSDPSSVVCSIGGGCETVLSSKYAKIFGISVAAYGALWYVAIATGVFLTYFRATLERKVFRFLLGLGLVFSLYLLGLEMFVIHAYCTWCLVSLAIVVTMTAVELFYQRTEVKNER